MFALVSKAVFHLVLVCHGLVYASTAIAAQNTIEHRIAVVEVAFVPYGNLVLIREILAGRHEDFSDPADLIGPCLPGKAGVRDLMASATGESAALLRGAMEQAGYAAVVALENRGGSFTASCAAPELLEIWLNHSRHARWRSRLPGVEKN